MNRKALTDLQKMSMGKADEVVAAANLPTYTELRDALVTLSVQAMHSSDQDDPLYAIADTAQKLACKAL